MSINVESINVSIVSPVYGCMDCLKELVSQVKKTMDQSELTWELILVDDRGPDKPWELIELLCKENPEIRGIKLSRNHGQHLAIWAGLEVARGEWMAVVDCDLQDDVSVIPTLYDEALKTKNQSLVVERGRWSDSLYRRIASKSFYKMIHYLSGIKINNIGNFGLYSREMVNNILLFQEQEVYFPIMVSLTGLETRSIRVDRSSRFTGTSSYSFKSLILLATVLVVRFSNRPLIISVFIGLLFSLLSTVVFIILIVGYLFGSFSVAGWTSVMLSLWFLAGVILTVLGVNGLYLGKIFIEILKRPRINVQKRTFTNNE